VPGANYWQVVLQIMMARWLLTEKQQLQQKDGDEKG
jgi:hypothetical protein